MSKVDWNWLENKIIEWFEYTHAKKSEFKSERGRLDFIKKVFGEVLKVVQDDPDEMEKAKKYIKERDEGRIEVLIKLQDQILEEITGVLKVIKDKKAVAYAASSFSARTHLAGESDLDFNVLVKDLNPEDIIRITEKLGPLDYKFTDTRGKFTDPNVHFVFAKYVKTKIGEVEIEFKLRSLKPYKKTIHLIHDFLDNKADEKDKIAITWIKSNLKHSKNTEAYAKFKALYYEWANSNTKSKELMYSLK